MLCKAEGVNVGVEKPRFRLLERKLGEQFREREAEAGAHILAVEGAGHAQEAVGLGGAVSERVALDGVDDPREARRSRNNPAAFR